MYMKNKRSPALIKWTCWELRELLKIQKENYGEVNDYLNTVPFPPFIVGSITFFEIVLRS
jgi:hypothetical protein